MPLYVIFMKSLSPAAIGLSAGDIVRGLYKEGGYGRFWQGWSVRKQS